MALNADRGNNAKAAASINAIFNSPKHAPAPFAMKKTTPRTPPKGTYPATKPSSESGSVSMPQAVEPPKRFSNTPAAPVATRTVKEEACVTEHSMEPESHSHEGKGHEPLIANKDAAPAPKNVSSYVKMSRSDIRRAFVMSEILGKPKSKR